uniref:G-protein coupled receptors family 1 profile domain-containing protein n=1 Tax=Arion vulgaris TaxID=1028688 RepID=A0A0B7AIL5_9EUPU
MAGSTQTPLTNGNTSWVEGDLFTWHGAELIFIPIMMFIGIVGNLLVFYIYHFRWHSNTVTLFKRMLAVLDLASLTVAFPCLLYVTASPHSQSFSATCILTSFVALGAAVASGCVLVIIAVDRFLKLCLLRKTGIGYMLSKKLFVASIIFACLTNIPCVWIFGRNTVYYQAYNIKVSYCFISSGSIQTPVFLVYAALLAVIFLSVSFILTILYYKIVKQLRELSKKHDELRRRPSLAGGTEIMQREKQSEVMRNSAIVFIAVTVVFFASYTPYFVTLVLSMADASIEGSMSPSVRAIYDLAKCCPIINNMANPFIYSFTSDRFREEIKKMLTFKTCEKGFFRRRGWSLSGRSQELSQVSDSKEET